MHGSTRREERHKRTPQTHQNCESIECDRFIELVGRFGAPERDSAACLSQTHDRPICTALTTPATWPGSIRWLFNRPCSVAHHSSATGDGSERRAKSKSRPLMSHKMSAARLFGLSAQSDGEAMLTPAIPSPVYLDDWLRRAITCAAAARNNVLPNVPIGGFGLRLEDRQAARESALSDAVSLAVQ